MWDNMNISSSKIQKLVDISRMYYEQDKTQNEIAQKYQVSRPLVSRMLKEARDLGIVRIEICSPMEGDRPVLNQLRNVFHIDGGAVVPNGSNDNITNDAVSRAAIQYMSGLGQKSFGIGWGHIIGNLVTLLENSEPVKGMASRVCPLIGNSGVGNRNYHSNELVRIFALQTGAAPEYFYAPSYVLSAQEMGLFKELESYQAVYKFWENLDVALVNIGNYPSVPDFASVARYGDALSKGKAVGRILNYYLDVNGTVFQSDTDYALQIPIEVLGKVKHVIGICSSNTSAKAFAGAMRTGLIHHVIAPEEVVKAAVDYVLS